MKQTRTAKFTIKEPSATDIKKVNEFFKAAAEVLIKKPFGVRFPEDNWHDWEDDHTDKILIQDIEKKIRKDEEISDKTPIDNRVLMFEFLKVKILEANPGFARVIMAAADTIDATEITEIKIIERGNTFYLVRLPALADDFYITENCVLTAIKKNQNILSVILPCIPGAYEKITDLNNISKQQAKEMVGEWATNVPDSYRNYLWPAGPHYYDDPVLSLKSRLQDDFGLGGGNYAILKLKK